ncbi:ABC transporter permease [Demequina mangrovi]|uniref:Transport permease protein n=1 Tax=Demequina mangrovi TaxID=1043493 RepID=A0A1H7AAT6_9MICO|nr:ABC transporter permease [Demequina mangrovi]SEJ59212.1 teichoic acid transport system permease protein [Demequina mangrovi]
MTEIDYAALAREAGLPRVGARQPLPAYLRELWDRRHFATKLARYRIEANLAQNRLGLLWVVLNPLLQSAVYGLVFGVIMPRSTREGENFIPYLVTGFFIFTYFSQSFNQGARAITGNTSLVRSLSFPRMLLPLSAVIRQIFELVPMMAVLAVILIGFGELPSWEWLAVPFVLVLMTMFNFGVALIAARLTVHLRDVTQIIPILTRLLMYLTGIFYSMEQVLADKPEWMMTVAQLNPVHDYISLIRYALLTDQPFTQQMVIVSVVAAIVFFFAGIYFFWTAEERYGRD